MQPGPGYLSLVLEKVLEKTWLEAYHDKEKEKLSEEQAETAKGKSGSRPCRVTARRSTCCLWTWMGSCWRKASPQAPATWLRTCCYPWLSWEGRSLFQGVPTAPPSLSSALGILSSRGWSWVFGQENLPYKEARCLWWTASDHIRSEVWLQGVGGSPCGAAAGRNQLLPTLQHSPPLQPGDSSICQGQGSSSQSLCVGYCAEGGQDRLVSCIFMAVLYSHVCFDPIFGKLCSFPKQTIQYHSNPSLCPNQ